MFQQTSQKRVLYSRIRMAVVVGLLSMAAVLSGGFALLSHPVYAAGTNSTLNFQARLEGAGGNIAPDGLYNIQFKLYDAGNAGSTLWTESYYDLNGTAAGSDNRVQVVNGYVSVNLGSQTAFPNTINWDQDLYVTMNIGGTTQTATPSYDGEMNPRLRLTGVPYAFRAGQLAQYNSSTGYTSTLSILQPTGGNQLFQIPNMTVGGTYNLCIQNDASCGFAPGAANSYVQNTATLQSGTTNFNISGTGSAATSILTPVLDTAGAVALNIGTTTATSVNIGRSTSVVTLQGTTGSSWKYLAGGFTTTLSFAAPTANNTITFPNAGGTVCTTTASTCSTTYQAAGSYLAKNTSDTSLSVTSGTMYTFTNNDAGTSGVLNLSSRGSGSAFSVTQNNNFAGTGEALIKANLTSGASGGNLLDLQFNGTSRFAVSGFGVLNSVAGANFGGIIQGTGAILTGTSSLTVGTSSSATGSILFKNGTNANTITLASGVATSSYQLTLPTALGASGSCLKDTNGAGLLGFSSCASVSTLQTAYTASTNPELTLDATRGALTIRDAATTVGNLLEIQNNAGSTTYFAVTAGGIQGNAIDTVAGTGTLNIGTTNATAINLNQNVTVAAGKSISLIGGITSTRPASPIEGMLYFDTTTKQLLVYANGKWQADRSTSTKIVGTSANSGTTGAVASGSPDGADFVNFSTTSAQNIINSAITSLPAGGGSVYLMEGTYIIDGSILLPSNVTLIGSGPATVIKFNNAINANLTAIANSGSTNIVVKSLILDGNRANNTSGTQQGIVMSSVGSGSGTTTVAGATVSDVTVRNFLSNGINFSTAVSSKILNTNIINNGSNIISNYGIYINGGSYNAVSNNQVQGNTAVGLYMSGTNQVATGNILEGNGGIGLYNLSAGAMITANKIDANNEGIRSSGSATTISGNSVRTSTAAAININGGTGSNVNGNDVSSNGDAGIIVNAANSVVSGNRIDSSAREGIYVSASDVLVSGNKLQNNAGSGSVSSISIDLSAARVSVVNNNITDTAGTGYAINIGAGTSAIYVSGNTYSGTGATSINDLGTATVFANQINSAGQLVNTASGALVARLQASATNDLFQAQDSTGNALLSISNTGTLSVGRASNTTGTIVLQNNTNANTVTVASGITSASYTLTLPTVVGSVNQCLSISSLTGGNAQLGFATCAGASVSLQGTSPGTPDNGNFNISGSGIAGSLQAGTASDGITLTSSGIVLAGTARNSKVIALTPEYAGAVLDPGSGANNSGTMTSGLDLTNRMNYYKWTTTSSTNQSYDVAIQIPIPLDFSAWSANPVSVAAYTSNTTSGTIRIEARDTNGATETNCNFTAGGTGTSVTPAGAAAWSTSTACQIAGSYTAGGYMTLRIRVQSGLNGDTRLGNIRLSYLSKF